VTFAQPAPAWLQTEEFVLRPIRAGDAELDHAAVVETRKHLRSWQQSEWPEDDFTVEANRKDLLDLERRHVEQRAFTYTVLSPNGTRCLGCVYVFPTTAAFLVRSTLTPVGSDEWADVDAVGEVPRVRGSGRAQPMSSPSARSAALGRVLASVARISANRRAELA
jgi:hypothetical protein